MTNQEKKIFIYLVPKNYKKKYNQCTELILIDEFIKLGYNIIPIYNLYTINILLKLLTQNVDGIIVNSIKILWNNKLLLKFNAFIPIYWWYFDNPFLKKKNHQKSIQIAKCVSIYFNKHYKRFDDYIKSGIKPIWLDQGTTSKCEFIKTKTDNHEIIFFGSVNIVHDERTKILKDGWKRRVRARECVFIPRRR